jgi:hypothetical protein
MDGGVYPAYLFYEMAGTDAKLSITKMIYDQGWKFRLFANNAGNGVHLNINALEIKLGGGVEALFAPGSGAGAKIEIKSLIITGHLILFKETMLDISR